MTDNEKREQKAMLLLESQEADSDLAHLCEKAQRTQQAIERIAQYVDQARAGVPSEHYYSDEERQSLRETVPTDPKYKTALDFPSIEKLVADIDKAKKKSDDLHLRKAQLGLR